MLRPVLHSSPTFQGYPKLQAIVKTKAVDEGIGPEPESAEDSNSFKEDSGSSIMSVSAKLHGTASSSTAIWSSDNQTYSSDRKEADEMEIRTEEDINSLSSGGQINLRQILEEQLLKFRTPSGHNENDVMEQSGDNETEDIIYSNDMNHNSYVLSSGRWNIGRVTQATTSKPTIDKEFEQYFSMLML